MATVTNELSGKIYKGKQSWQYSTMYHGDEFCHDFTEEFDWAGRIYDKDGDLCPDEITPSWGGGVVDDGAERLAVVLLVCAHSGYDDVEYMEKVASAVVEERVNNLYRQFAKEVVAHLPDNWSMSKAEILEWIDKKEKKK